MSRRDDHERASWTCPTPRHQLPTKFQKTAEFHDVTKFARPGHNHPSGDVTPSLADIDMTRQIIGMATPLGIRVHDHIIVGRGKSLSMRTERYID